MPTLTNAHNTVVEVLAIAIMQEQKVKLPKLKREETELFPFPPHSLMTTTANKLIRLQGI